MREGRTPTKSERGDDPTVGLEATRDYLLNLFNEDLIAQAVEQAPGQHPAWRRQAGWHAWGATDQLAPNAEDDKDDYDDDDYSS